MTRNCPACGALLKCREIRVGGSFTCPSCHARLQAQEYYAPLAFWGSILLALGVLVAFGFRGLHLLGFALLTAYPAVYIGVNYMKYLIPPKIEAYLPKDSSLRLGNGPR